MEMIKKHKKMGKKGQVDIAIVIGSIIVPVSALIGALMFAWLLLSPVVDLCRIAQVISYDISSLSDLAYSMPDDITIVYKGPSVCTFYSMTTLPIRVSLDFVGTTIPGYYKGEFYDHSGDMHILEIHNPTGSGYDSYKVDGFEYYSMGSMFQIGDVNYTINSKMERDGVIHHVVLTVESPDKLPKSIFSCMDQRLTIPHVKFQITDYTTNLSNNVKKDFSFFSMSNIPGTVYDPADELFYQFSFHIRSYANPQDESIRRYGGTISYKVDDGVFISKQKTGYYDTLASTNMGKNDIIYSVGKTALQVCNTGEPALELQLSLPPLYNFSIAGSSMSLFKTVVPVDISSTETFKLINSMNLNELLAGSSTEGGAQCTYRFEDDASFYSVSGWTHLNMSVTISSAQVIIDIKEAI